MTDHEDYIGLGRSNDEMMNRCGTACDLQRKDRVGGRVKNMLDGWWNGKRNDKRLVALSV